MPEYRKIGTRTFYKRTNANIITVITNMEKRSLAEMVEDWMIADEIFGDHPDPRVKPCTEEEFNAAKSEAMKRLQSEQI